MSTSLRRGSCSFLVALVSVLAPAHAQSIPLCPADFDRDGYLAYQDFDAFIVAFESGNAAADLNADAMLTFEDFDAFMVEFADGCSERRPVPLFPGTSFFSLDNPTGVAFGDFDGDGRVDMAASSADSGSVVVWRNLSVAGGPINLDQVVNVRFDYLPQAVAVGDLNGDGRPDIATAMSDRNLMGVAMNTSIGPGFFRFGTSVLYPAGVQATSVAMGDLDGDGDLDIGVACYAADAVWLYRNDGRGSFSPLASVGTGSRPRGLILSDINGDSKADIIVANDLGSSVSVIRNTTIGSTGDISFAARDDYAAPARSAVLCIGDFDADGRVDLASASSTIPVVSLRLNQGDGTFGPRTDLSVPAVVSSLAAVDADADGRIDIVTTSYYAGSIGTFRNTSTAQGTLQFEPMMVQPSIARPWSLGAKDLNADGFPDLAVVSSWGDSIGVLRSLAGRGFETRVERGAGSDPRSVAIGDLNGDGRPEIVTANYAGVTASVITNLGVGAFSASQEIAIGGGASSIEIADLNDDGRAEMIVTNINDAAVGIMRNTGAGSLLAFAPPLKFSTPDGPYASAVGDLDGDGRPDLAISNYRSNSVSVFRNVSTAGGNVAFDSRIDLSVGNGPRQIRIADMDRDGKPDLIVGHRNELSYCILRNLSSPEDGIAFATRQIFPVEFTGERLSVGDMDNDGWPDLFVINYYSNRFVTQINNHDGSFRTGPTGRTSREPWTSAVADVNNDGALDILIVNLFSNSVSVYLNTLSIDGMLAFGPRNDYCVGLYPYAMAIGDLNADGSVDVAVANSQSSSTSILLNAVGSAEPARDAGTRQPR